MWLVFQKCACLHFQLVQIFHKRFACEYLSIYLSSLVCLYKLKYIYLFFNKTKFLKIMFYKTFWGCTPRFFVEGVYVTPVRTVVDQRIQEDPTRKYKSFIMDLMHALCRCSIHIMSFTILQYSFDEVQVFTPRQLILKFLSRNALHFTQLFLCFYKQLKADNRSNQVILNTRSALHALQ